jgi:hypothetical protein
MGDSPFAKFSQLDQTGRGCVYIDADWSHFPTAASMLWAPDTDKVCVCVCVCVCVTLYANNIHTR